MQTKLASLVSACVEAHIKTATTTDAKRQFSALIQHAYDLGVKDGKESAEENHQGPSKESSPSSKGSGKSVQQEAASTKSSEAQAKKESGQKAEGQKPGPDVLAAINNF